MQRWKVETQVTRSYWNTSHGRFEREARRSIKAANLGPVDGLAALSVLALAVSMDQRLNSHALTLADDTDYGNQKFLWHANSNLAELGRAMDRCLLTPQSRIPYEDAVPVVDPFAEIADNVRSILRD